MRIFVLDPNGGYDRDAEIDEVGAIAVAGPNLFSGYLNPAHNDGLWIERPDELGGSVRWLNTGDLGRVDSDGYFWLTGRKKELIIRGGHNVDPKQIEDGMYEHTAVALAAAVGRPDTHAGEVPVVYVQLRDGIQATEDELLAHAQRRIAERAAWPKRVNIVRALPVTAVGKIFKPALSLLQMELVVREEATAIGLELKCCTGLQDPQRGLMVRWSSVGDGALLRMRLRDYTFFSEELTLS